MKSGSVYRRNLPSQWPVLGFRFGLGVLLLNTVRLFTTLPPTDYKEMPLQIHTRSFNPGWLWQYRQKNPVSLSDIQRTTLLQASSVADRRNRSATALSIAMHRKFMIISFRLIDVI